VARPHGENDAPGGAWGSLRGPGGITGLEAASGSAPDWCERGRSGSIGTPLTPGIADKPDTHVSLCAPGPFHDCLTPPPPTTEPVGAENLIQRPYAASLYSWTSPPSRSDLRSCERSGQEAGGEEIESGDAWSRVWVPRMSSTGLSRRVAIPTLGQ